MNSKKQDDYYVYVYIDPRNYEEFYYGKGKGSRKEAHLKDGRASSKTKRIKAIRKEGLEPIIRVVARGLSESEALLVEKTLLWKLGKWTTNKASGHFAKKFRPLNSNHRQIDGFDYRRGLYYYNVGEGQHRNWDDYRKYGFISAGQGEKWGRAMRGFNKGDIFVAYMSRRGFVGVGRVTSEAKMIREVIVNGRPLLALPLNCKRMDENCSDFQKSEYVCLVKWIKKVPRTKARSVSKKRLFTTQQIRAVLKHKKTINFLNRSFKVNLRRYIK